MNGHRFAQLVRCSDFPAIVTALASTKDNIETEALLTAPDEDGHSALHWAAMSEHAELLNNLLPFVKHVSVDVRSAATPQAEQTPLHWACIAGNVRGVRALLDAGADPATHDAKGYNAPIHAAQYGHIDVLHVLLNTYDSLLPSVDHTGNSLLQWAAYYNHHLTVRYLTVVHGLCPNSADHTETTALHRAARANRDLVADVLLRAGADPRLEDHRNRTPLELAPPHTRTTILLQNWLSATLTVQRPHPKRHTLSRYALILFYYFLMIFSYYFYSSFVMPQSLLPPIVHVVSHISIFVSIISHLRATLRDPGAITPGTKQQFIEYIENSLENGDSSIRLLSTAFCHTCLSERPQRSKHSRDRDVCIRLFDHECPWLNNTIGLNTHKPLLALVASTAIVQVIFIYAVIRIFVLDSTRTEVSFLLILLQHSFLTFILVLNAIVALFCITLLLTHIRMISRGLTTYETMNSERLNKSSQTESTKSARHNILAFLTSTGPGTGNPYVPMSLSALLSFLMSTGESDVSKLASTLSIARKKISSAVSERTEGHSLIRQHWSGEV